jgi:hypothetical protein
MRISLLDNELQKEMGVVVQVTICVAEIFVVVPPSIRLALFRAVSVSFAGRAFLQCLRREFGEAVRTHRFHFLWKKHETKPFALNDDFAFFDEPFRKDSFSFVQNVPSFKTVRFEEGFQLHFERIKGERGELAVAAFWTEKKKREKEKTRRKKKRPLTETEISSYQDCQHSCCEHCWIK